MLSQPESVHSWLETLPVKWLVAIISVLATGAVSTATAVWLWLKRTLALDHQRIADIDATVVEIKTNHLHEVRGDIAALKTETEKMMNSMANKQDRTNEILLEQSGYLKALVDKL